MEHRAVEGVDDLLVVAPPAGRQRHPNERPVLAIESFLDGHQVGVHHSCSSRSTNAAGEPWKSRTAATPCSVG
jgi:hypothetical protein